MTSILMVYTSMTGNTEEIAQAIATGIRDAGGDITEKDILDADPIELNEYDGILLGSYTWGDGELPDEYIDFYEDLSQINLAGKKGASFGSGDSCYAEFCAAVDLLNEKIKETGAEVILDGLKIELSPETEELEQCRQFGIDFTERLKDDY